MNEKLINVGIVGATGYVGAELVRLLTNHSKCKIYGLTSKSYVDESFSNIYKGFKTINDDLLMSQEVDLLANKCDVIFFALPHSLSSKLVTKSLLKETRVIDLGADFRFDNLDTYESWYGEHYSKEINKEAVYGLVELNRKDIIKASIVGNPGCYTTCSIMGLAPIVGMKDLIDQKSIIINAYSGVSGSGRKVGLGTHYVETNESIKAYAIASHRHTPEIEEKLSQLSGEEIILNFTPHLIPMNRGILSTIYVNLKKDTKLVDIVNIYKDFYKGEKFVRIIEDGCVESRFVKGSNYVDIGVTIDTRTNRLIINSTIDNLMKGAASQGIQNMNVMFGFEEDLGIDFVPMFI